jgi:2-polyprenyl-6-methoxyphenol hydroxylase-like FAD-dependent oxidoreductase
MSEVLIVGAGPVGLSMALELARHGVRSRIIDRALQPSAFCRAIGVTPRTLEIWESMGVARDMIEAGLWLIGTRSIINGGPAEDFVNPPLGLPYSALGIPQYSTERVLARHLARFGIRVERGLELITLQQRDGHCRVTLSNSDRQQQTDDFRFVIGCDGAHSVVRRQLSIAFEGDAYPWSFMLGDVRIEWSLPYGMALRSLRLKAGGPPDLFVAIPLPERGRYRVSMLAPASIAVNKGSDHGIQAELPGPALGDLQSSADDLLPEAPRLSDLRWSSIFRISMRLAARYRVGNAFIAGDAAHIHPPTGGQGMNTGIQDAHNLAWKLASVLAGRSPQALLDSYELERRPVGQAVIASTRSASERIGRERATAESRLAESQVTVSYRGTAHVRDDASAAAGPCAGDRAPDVNGLIANGLGFPLRLFDLLDGIDYVLIIRVISDSAGSMTQLSQLSEQLRGEQYSPVRVVIVTPQRLPAAAGLRILWDEHGAFAAAYGSEAAAFLVRPDGHVGWRGRDWQHPGLLDALRVLPAALP